MLNILLRIYPFCSALEYLKLKNTRDWFAKIFHNLATGLSIFSCSSFIILILFCVTALLKYLDLFHAKCAVSVLHSPLVPIMPTFCSLLLLSYFFKKFAGKTDVSLAINSNNKRSRDYIL